ncbi:MAG: hypothetical protein C5B47_07035 [Verrucomicrobia bacterium]|nr:MAG: hypothetical protein C5B47_07035 [Verrucomicrobiota bacterium]
MKFWFFAIYTFMVGATVGSFLNVCIYRLPRNISLWRQCRSFCPLCQKILKWRVLVPIFSWLFLKGRCAECCGAISFRYIFVEILSGGLFAFFWMTFDFPQSAAFCLLGALLITATFLDLETLTIPNPLTIGGVLAGLALSVISPAALGEQSANSAVLKATTGAIMGYLLLWGVLEAGKLCFGHAQYRWKVPQKFCFLQDGENTIFECAGERWKGEEMFVRKSDELIIETDFWQTPMGAWRGDGTIRLKGNCLCTLQGKLALRGGQQICGEAVAIRVPREALGWGDVKLLAAIGAFIGASGVLFTVFCASLLGAFVGLWLLLFREWNNRPIPFGPFLAAGAFTWILADKLFGTSMLSHLPFRL